MLGTRALMAANARRGGRRVDVAEAKSLSAKVKIKSALATKTKIAASGRSSSGRITIFHRGGGSKRLLRNVDMKRSTSAVGIVESIEYDPNRSSRIAAVRWVDGVHVRKKKEPINAVGEFAPARKLVEPATTTIRGQFSLYAMPGKVVQRKMACSSPGLAANTVVVGVPGAGPTAVPHRLRTTCGSQKTSVKDVLLSAFSSPRVEAETRASFGCSNGLPRVAVVGARPGFISTRMREELCGKDTAASGFEVRKWAPQGVIWEHKSKRKAAVSWQSSRSQEGLGLVGATEIA